MTRLILGSELKDILNKLNFTSALLIAPPIYDMRLEWPQWHQPMGLLKLGRKLRADGKDVRLIDCLYFERGTRLLRRKLPPEIIDDRKFDRWHLGLPYEQLELRIRGYLAEQWVPEIVFIASLNTIWWESVRETILRVKRLLPDAMVILGGAYPTIEPEHALEHSGADAIFSGPLPGMADYEPDLRLYVPAPYSTGINFYKSSNIFQATSKLAPRAISRIIDEMRTQREYGVREFVFMDEEIRLEDRETLSNLMDAIVENEIDAHIVFPGNIPPQLITQRLASKLKNARVKQIYLRCELDFSTAPIQYTVDLREYERCAKALLEYGGFKPRDGNLAAMLVIGLPYENLDEVCERLIRLAHVVGSVIPVPFQYVLGLHKGALFNRALSQNDSFTPEKFNSKTFPVARFSGQKIEEYLEITRLAALLNSKYRSKTFDFLGDDLTARLFRESIRTKGWNPFVGRSIEATGAAEIELVES